jgi:DNA-binding CsgD family transcriptional regulator
MAQDDLLALAEALRLAEDPFVPFQAFLLQHGARGFFYGYTVLRSDLEAYGYTRSLYSRHTYPEEWERVIGSETLLEHEYSVHRIQRGVACVTWHPENPAQALASLTAPQRRQFDTEHEMGLVSGASVILESGGSLFSGLGIWCETQTKPQEFTRAWAARGPELWQAGRLLDAAVRRDRPNLLVCLTPRELDCLSWLACGLRPAEICWRLGISEKTFEKHICAAKAKLKARTRDQALAKAVLMGLLPL